MGWIKNARNGKKICVECEVADTPLARSIGLMFARKPKCILFKFDAEGVYPIHSFFVNFPFDAVYLDAQMRAVEIFESIEPFTPLVVPRKKAAYLLEMPQGSAKKLGLVERDAVRIYAGSAKKGGSNGRKNSAGGKKGRRVAKLGQVRRGSMRTCAKI